MVNDGIILIDDCGWPTLPGPKLACEEFLEDKEEDLLFERGHRYEIVKLDDSFPDYLLKNINKFKDFIDS